MLFWVYMENVALPHVMNVYETSLYHFLHAAFLKKISCPTYHSRPLSILVTVSLLAAHPAHHPRILQVREGKNNSKSCSLGIYSNKYKRTDGEPAWIVNLLIPGPTPNLHFCWISCHCCYMSVEMLTEHTNQELHMWKNAFCCFLYICGGFR